MQDSKTKCEERPVCLSLLRAAYFTHLVLALAFSIYLLTRYPALVSSTITFAMILIYGFMLVWLLLLSFILIVSWLPFRPANGRSERSA